MGNAFDDDDELQFAIEKSLQVFFLQLEGPVPARVYEWMQAVE